MNQATKCLIYRRYSSDEQGKGEGDTLVTQLAACEAYAARKGWKVVEVLTDEGFSAYKGEHLQPGASLYEFVERVHRGEIERGTILLAYKQNRLSRRPLDEAMVWIYSLTSRGIGIATCDSEHVYEANPSIEAYLGMSLKRALANKESADKSDLIRAARKRLWEKAERREGKWTNLATRHPSWLKPTEERNGWIVDNERAGLIRDIYQWSADGMGAVLITNRINEMNVRPWGKWHRYDDGMWGRTAVRQLLMNPAVEGDFAPSKTGMFGGKVLQGFYPRIVDADVVAKARAQQRERQKSYAARAVQRAPSRARTERKTAGRKSGAFSSLFAGITRCGECGKRAFLTSSVSKGRYYPYIRCEGAGDGRCENTGYYAYAAFESTALDLCVDLALDDRFFEATGELREFQIRKAELEKLIAERRAQRTRIMAKFDDDDEDAIALANKLKVEINGLKAQLQANQAEIEKASGRVGAEEHLRRVNDILVAARSDDAREREQARGKLRLALHAILNMVEVERTSEGQKVFTLTFLNGVMAVRIDNKGKVVDARSESVGRPLWEFLSPERRAITEPLIRRIRERAGV